MHSNYQTLYFHLLMLITACIIMQKAIIHSDFSLAQTKNIVILNQNSFDK